MAQELVLTSHASVPLKNFSSRVEPPLARSPLCAVQMHQQEQSSQAAQPVVQRRWLFSMWIIQISKSSSRQRFAKKTRFALFAMPDSIWILVARTSSRFSTRTQITRFVSRTSSCAHTRTAKISVLSLAQLAKSLRPSKLASCSAPWPKPLGPVLTQEFSTTTPLTIGTQTQRPVVSTPRTLALSTCHSTTHHATSLR